MDGTSIAVVAANAESVGFTNDELVAILPALRLFSMNLIRKDRPRADDLLQDTVLRMMEKRHLYRAGTNLKAWGFKIMQNHYLSSIRPRPIQIFSLSNYHIGDPDSDASQDADREFRAPDPKPDEMIDLKRRWATLAPKQQMMMTRYVAGDSYQELAARFGYANVKSTMNRIREALRP